MLYKSMHNLDGKKATTNNLNLKTMSVVLF